MVKTVSYVCIAWCYAILCTMIFTACPATTKQMIQTESTDIEEVPVPARNMIVEMESYKGKSIKKAELSVPFYKTSFYGVDLDAGSAKKLHSDSSAIRNAIFKGLASRGGFNQVSYFPIKIGEISNQRKFELPGGSSFVLNLPPDGKPVETKSSNTYFLIMDTLRVLLKISPGTTLPNNFYSGPSSQANFVTNFALWDNSTGNVISYGSLKAKNVENLGEKIIQKSPFKK